MSEDLIKRSDAAEVVYKALKTSSPKGALTDTMSLAIALVQDIPSADNEVIGKLKTAIENEEICKSCPTAERISGENLLGAMALGFSYGMEADRPQGEWIETLDGNEWYWCCSNCKEQWYEEDLWMGGNEFPHFCPHCGAKMKRIDDDYERAVEQMGYDMLYEPTYNPEDGSM